jgi:hypothetical protein
MSIARMSRWPCPRRSWGTFDLGCGIKSGAVLANAGPALSAATLGTTPVGAAFPKLWGWIRRKNMRTTISLIVAATLVGVPAAIAQTTGTPNSSAGVQGMQGNKSGPATKNSGNQSNGTTQDTSKIPGMTGNKSGPPAQKPSRNDQSR